jgi:toxin CptA
MQKSKPSSNASAQSRPSVRTTAGRLEWRPSFRHAFALALLGACSAVATLASGLSPPFAAPLSVGALVAGLHLAGRELRGPRHRLVIGRDDVVPTIDGNGMDELKVRWRGPLVFLQWRDAGGRVRRLCGGPGNLDAAARRELRLAMTARTPSRPPRSVAP